MYKRIIIIQIFVCLAHITCCNEFAEYFDYCKNYGDVIKKEYTFFAGYYNNYFNYLKNDNFDNINEIIDEYINITEQKNNDNNLLLEYIRNRFISYFLLIKSILVYKNNPTEATELLYMGRHFINKIKEKNNNLIFNFKTIPPAALYNKVLLTYLSATDIEELKCNLLDKYYDESFFYLKDKNNYSFIKEDFNKRESIDSYFVLIMDISSPLESILLRNYKKLNYLQSLNDAIEIFYNKKVNLAVDYINEILNKTNLKPLIQESNSINFLEFYLIGSELLIDELKQKYLYNAETQQNNQAKPQNLTSNSNSLGMFHYTVHKQVQN